MQIFSSGSNEYLVLEVSDWVSVTADILRKPGKIKKSTDVSTPLLPLILENKEFITQYTD